MSRRSHRGRFRGAVLAAVLLPVVLVLLLRAPARADDEGRAVTIETADGARIAGVWWAPPDPGGAAVVLLHMYRGEGLNWAPLLPHLRARRLGVLAIDLRGHGRSAVQGGEDLRPLVVARDTALFAKMHEDATAAVRWAAEEGGADPARIGFVGASVGCSVAFDAAARAEGLVRAIACLTPGREYLGLGSVEHVGALGEGVAVALASHADETPAGLDALAAVLDERPAEASAAYVRRVFTGRPPPGADPRGFFHGTRMFGRVPMIEAWVAGFMAEALGAVDGAALLDGRVAEERADGAWQEATEVPAAGGDSGELWAYRVDDRVVFGGRVPLEAERVRLLVAGLHGARLVARLDAEIFLPPAMHDPLFEGAELAGVGTTAVDAERPWAEPPVRALFHREGDGVSFEGELVVPGLAGAADADVALAWGPGGVLGEAVDPRDFTTWTRGVVAR